MSKTAKKWLLAAGITVLVGAVIFVGALSAIGFDFAKLGTQKFVKNTYEFSEDFENISLDIKTAEVVFAFSENGLCKVECFEEERLTHSVKIQDGTLIIEAEDGRKWYDFIGINSKEPEVKVFLPKEAYKSLFADTATGDIELSAGLGFESVKVTGTTANISCYARVSKSAELNTATGDIVFCSAETETVNLSAQTGDITVSGVFCNTLTVKNRTGDTELENVLAKERLAAESTTGSIEFERCDAPDIAVKTTTGDVEGTLLSEKIFITSTGTGWVRVPRSDSGGKCEISTATGNIEIEIR